jgi:hypothetical protein
MILLEGNLRRMGCWYMPITKAYSGYLNCFAETSKEFKSSGLQLQCLFSILFAVLVACRQINKQII